MKRGWLLAAGFAALFGAKCILDRHELRGVRSQLEWYRARLDHHDRLWELMLEDEGVPS